MRRLLCFLTLASAPLAHAHPRPFALASGARTDEVPARPKPRPTDPELARRLFTPLRRCAARRVWHGFDLPKPPPRPARRRIGLAPMSPWAGGSGVKLKIPI